jgi:hypothetical protein
MSLATVAVCVLIVLASLIVAVGMWVAPRDDRDDEADEES